MHHLLGIYLLMLNVHLCAYTGSCDNGTHSKRRRSQATGALYSSIDRQKVASLTNWGVIFTILSNFRCVDMVITELGVFELQDNEMVLTEIGIHISRLIIHWAYWRKTSTISSSDPDTSLDAVRAATGMDFKVSDGLTKMAQLWWPYENGPAIVDWPRWAGSHVKRSKSFGPWYLNQHFSFIYLCCLSW